MDIEPGSALARTLLEVWSGRPVTIVASPPGGGKTTLLAKLAAVLVSRLGESVTIATPTNRAGADIAMRVHGILGYDDSGYTRVEVPGANMAAYLPEGFARVMAQGQADGAHVCVKTVASLIATRNTEGSILISDEAWQSTYSDLASAADSFDQLVMVGDPGQIGPVVSIETRAWESMRYAPHLSAPEVFKLREESTVINIDKTFRLGAEGIDVVAPLYDFDFESRRGERFMELDGFRLPEVAHLDLGSGNDPFDPDMLSAVADRAVDLLSGTYVDVSGVRHTLEGRDVAVVVSRNAQRAYVNAKIGELGITVGTADSLQGGQWPAVVALDPMIGYDTATPHSMSVGRLCVMLSRQMAHVTWVHGNNWRKALEDTDADPLDRDRSLAVREVMETVKEV